MASLVVFIKLKETSQAKRIHYLNLNLSSISFSNRANNWLFIFRVFFCFSFFFMMGRCLNNWTWGSSFFLFSRSFFLLRQRLFAATSLAMMLIFFYSFMNLMLFFVSCAWARFCLIWLKTCTLIVVPWALKTKFRFVILLFFVFDRFFLFFFFH